MGAKQAENGPDLLGLIHGAGLAVSSEAPSLRAANERGGDRYGDRPHAHAPGYIHACHECKWTLATWRKSSPADVTWRPARCNSWRHGGPCARKKASEDYARIRDALAQHDRGAITYAVLTLDPSAWTGEGWEGFQPRRERREGAVKDDSAIGQAYKALCERWTVLAAAIKRRWGAFAYVSTVECHRSGWPHLNVILVNGELAQEADLEARRLALWGRKSRGREVAKRVFGAMLESAGFGKIAFLEKALELAENGTDQLAAYVAKLAGAAGGVWDGEKRGLTAPADDAPAGAVVHSLEGQTIGEIAKLSQAPIVAPSHFRRLRSSKGFLPPKRRDPEITGALYNEHGQELGQNMGDRLVAAALSADTEAALSAIESQTARLDDKHRRRDGEPESKLATRLADVFEVIRKKRIGALPLEDLNRERARAQILAPRDRMAIGSRDDVERWIGEVGPGMGPTAKRYTLRRTIKAASAGGPSV